MSVIRIAWLSSVLAYLALFGCSAEEESATSVRTDEILPRSSNIPYSSHPQVRITRSDVERAYVKGRDGSQYPDFSKDFERLVNMVPMRDGIRLHTEIYQPRKQSAPLPILLTRTPYGLSHGDNGYSHLMRMYPDLIQEGYIFVFQDVRGRNGSEGTFVTLGPLEHHTSPEKTDESTDAYDTIDWLVKNVNQNNARVGILGISYGGFLTTRALVDPHPALRAASPQGTCADMFIGDDWHHNGAFRLEYSFGWISAMEQNLLRGKLPGYYDSYEAFLDIGPLSNINERYLHGLAPSWKAFIEHPNYDDYWIYDMCGVLPHVQRVTVPTLNVVGWFDAEDFYGPLKLYSEYEKSDPDNLNHVVIGPWYHGGWSYSRNTQYIGPIDLGSDTSKHFRSQIQAPWFAYWLKDEGTLNLPEVTAFRTGSNTWDEFSRWPPEKLTERKALYLGPSGGLSFVLPEDMAGYDSYLSDPDNPVPYRYRPVTSYGWAEWQLEDQRLADGRPDVLVYETAPLSESITITGEPIAHLYASTTGTDSDWIVKLIDVYPQDYQPAHMSGYQLLVAGEIFRARYRDSFSHPTPVTPEKPTYYEINLRSRNHTFRRGHRIMVQIQSTWFPLYDRNPQNYVDNIYKAVADDFTEATQRVYRTKGHPSHISLPIVTEP